MAGFREAMELAKSAASSIRRVWRDFRKSAYQSIAEIQINAGDIAGAKSTASSIASIHLKLHTYSDIAEAQAKVGELAGLLRWIKGLKTPYERAHAYLGAVQGLMAK